MDKLYLMAGQALTITRDCGDLKANCEKGASLFSTLVSFLAYYGELAVLTMMVIALFGIAYESRSSESKSKGSAKGWLITLILILIALYSFNTITGNVTWISEYIAPKLKFI